MKPPFVSIIIPAYHAVETLQALAESLKNLDYPRNKYEVLFVLDVACGKEEEHILKRYPFKVIRNTKRGSAANRNLGVRKASKKATYFAFTDADCYADKEWLKELVKGMEEAPQNVIAIGGVNLVPKSESNFSELLGAMEQTLLGGNVSSQTAQKTEKRYVPSLPNCNALYKRKAWEEEKQDEALLVGQDGEFNYRLSKRGYKFLLIPQAKIWHHREHFSHVNTKIPWWNFFMKMYKYGEATGKIARKHPKMILIRWYAIPPALFIPTFIITFFRLFTNLLNNFWTKSLNWLLNLFWVLYLVLIIIVTVQVWITVKSKSALWTPFLLIGQHFFYGLGSIIGFLKSLFSQN